MSSSGAFAANENNWNSHKGVPDAHALGIAIPSLVSGNKRIILHGSTAASIPNNELTSSIMNQLLPTDHQKTKTAMDSSESL
jgi:hypothetical protein